MTVETYIGKAWPSFQATTWLLAALAVYMSLSVYSLATHDQQLSYAAWYLGVYTLLANSRQ